MVDVWQPRHVIKSYFTEPIICPIREPRGGACLARNETEQVDLVAGIPDSGIGHAGSCAPDEAYSHQGNIQDRRILFCDDSVVRGTKLQDNTQILYEYGAKEVHMRIACPCLIHPCEFLNFSTSRSTLDLAGPKAIYEIEGTEDIDLTEYAVDGSEKHRAMVDHINDRLGATSLRYQKLEDLVVAIGLPKEKLCTHCWDNSSYY